MESTSLSAGPGHASGPGAIKKIIARAITGMSVAEKSYAIMGGLIIVTVVLLAMSIQTVRLQSGYQHLQTASMQAGDNVGRVNALIYAIVMESRGVYMSTERAKAKQFAEELLKRNRELAEVMKQWGTAIRADDAAQFEAFRQRINRFIEFRKELARRGIEVSAASAREWGDNDANRTLRSQLNTDLEALQRIYRERASDAAELGDQGRYASWYLCILGIGAALFAVLNVILMRSSVVGPLSEITAATARIAAGDTAGTIPHLDTPDEIGKLALAVEDFRKAVSRNAELEQLGIYTARARDAAMDERDKFSDKYQATKWQLSAAINTMPQGIIMLDARMDVLAINDRYRKLYDLPATIVAGASLEAILQHRVKSGLFIGDVAAYLAAIQARIAKRAPGADEITLSDGRIIGITEQAMDGGGWVAVHEDVTEQRLNERALKRTEQFLATIIENIPEGIIAKDARNLRYVFVNRAAEQMIGMSRGEIMGKTARELFSAEAADLIERRDRQLMERKQQLEEIVDTIDNPVRGRRTIAVRRLQIGGPDGESQLFVSMVEDRTRQADVAA
ncbi:PAS-domain containing protein [Bradyrhizobium jicamae]|uniref:PAS-domain containing protein n=1 Tax=Bradyrhizobium jicamae TaxID=280332 RepID=UPI001BAC5002|nr:PAS-domain containing protein [Bradyrhizobium jicamae]MBR0753964.1 PAS-domain containing protein [Bradyrhizobium jicamae]